MAVVDASVVVAFLHKNDLNHQIANRWVSQLINSGGRFNAPTILLSEVTAPLARGHGLERLSKQIIDSLTSASYIELFPVTLPLAKQAASIAATHKIRGCDAIYVALAESLGQELITLDKQQRERAKDIIQAREPY